MFVIEAIQLFCKEVCLLLIPLARSLEKAQLNEKKDHIISVTSLMNILG